MIYLLYIRGMKATIYKKTTRMVQGDGSVYRSSNTITQCVMDCDSKPINVDISNPRKIRSLLKGMGYTDINVVKQFITININKYR